MIERIQAWWRLRSSRECGLLAVLAAIAVPTLLWYGVIRPMDRSLEAAQRARDAEARNLADVLLMAGKIRGADRPVRDTRPVDALILADAERAGFTVASVARDGDGALLMIDAVRSQPFFAWVAAMKQRRGMAVTRLTARPNGDSTLSIAMRFQRAR
jgi:general secretion pathway protein M